MRLQLDGVAAVLVRDVILVFSFHQGIGDHGTDLHRARLCAEIHTRLGHVDVLNGGRDIHFYLINCLNLLRLSHGLLWVFV